MQTSLERLRQRRTEEDEKGFTLIELLIVIVILGILAAIVVFAVQNLTGQSATAACQSEYKTVETAMEAYKAQVGSYPTDFTQLQSSTTQSIAGGTVGPWLKDTVPTNTTDNSNYWFGIGAGSGGSLPGSATTGDIVVFSSGNTTGTVGNGACSKA